jgi:hypothetical protein
MPVAGQQRFQALGEMAALDQVGDPVAEVHAALGGFALDFRPQCRREPYADLAAHRKPSQSVVRTLHFV